MVQRIKGLYITDTRLFQRVRQSGANADMVISIDVSVSIKNERTRTDLFKSTSSCSELAGKKSTVVLQDYSPIKPLQRGKILTQKLKLKG